MFDVIIPANGRSVRAGFDKLSKEIGEITVLQRTVNAFSGLDGVGKIIIVGDKEVSGAISVPGGATRAESVNNALRQVSAEYVIIHDGARPFVSRELIKKVMKTTEKYGTAIPSLPLTDTLMLKDGDSLTESADRTAFSAVQTPQGFRTEQLKRAFAEAIKTGTLSRFTDESSLYSAFIEPCRAVEGELSNKKITYESDFYGINAKVGSGFDLHRFTPGKPLRLCGTDIPYEYGLLAHSDGDVAVHALMDALLTASGERDIGVLFPDDDPAYENIDSLVLLGKVISIVREKNLSVASVNLILMAQRPRLSPYIEKMRQTLAAFLDLSPDSIGISATTTENVGIVGENKAIASFATVVLI